MKVAIVGAGICGLSAATLLARDGHRVTVFERRPALDPAGTGLLLQPVALDVLQELGLRDRIVLCGARIDRLCRKDVSGRTVLELHYDELARGLHGVGIQRGVLSTLLLDAACAAGAIVEFGVSVAGLREDASAVAVLDSIGQALDRFDVVALCDGQRSRVRELLPLQSRSTPHPWGVLCTTAPRPLHMVSTPVLLQHYRSANDFVGLLPSGRDAQGVDTVSFFWNVRVADRNRVVAGDFEAWRARMQRDCPECSGLLGPLTRFDQLLFATYCEVEMERWHTKRVIVMGDAAHGLDPQLGMGANMALADASSLASCIRHVDRNAVERALRAYQEAREPQLRFYQWASRTLAPLMRTDSRLISRSRQLLLGAGVPGFARREMLKAVCGYARA